MKYLLMLAALATTRCSSLPGELEPFDGVFAYRAFDDGGTLVLTGTLLLDVASNGAVSGTWAIERVPGTDPQIVVGPQVGEGELIGSVEDGGVVLELNPGVSDNNVGLLGTLDDGAIVGMWSYVTFVGPTAMGEFSAVKLR